MNIVPDGVQRAQKSKKYEPEVVEEEDDGQQQMADPNMQFEAQMADEYGSGLGKKKKKKKKKKSGAEETQIDKDQADIDEE